MAVYIAELVLVPLVGVLFSKSIKLKFDTKKKIYMITIFVVLFFISAFRDISVGTDTSSYAYAIRSVAKQTISIKWLFEKKAPLYYVLIKIGSKIFPLLQTYQIVSSIIIEGTFAYFIYKYSKGCILSTWLFLVQYFYFLSLNISRQAMAMGLIAIAIGFILDNKKRWAIMSIILAILIHSTSVVAIPILFLDNPNKKIQLLTILVACAGISMYPMLLNVFVRFFPKYAFYLDELFYEKGRNRKVLLTIFQLAFLLFSYYIYKKNKNGINDEEKRKYEFILNMSTIGIFLGFTSLQSILITRIEYFYSFSFLLLAPLTASYSGKNRKMVTIIVALVMFIPGFVLLMNGNGGILPYVFFRG